MNTADDTTQLALQHIEAKVLPCFDGNLSEIGMIRAQHVQAVSEALRQKPLPWTTEVYLAHSLIPSLLQELNWDDIHWLTQEADLGHLGPLLELDVLIATGGKKRNELSTTEWEAYANLALQAIE